MPWARLDDNFHDHRKVLELSLDAVGLYTLCLTWAHRNTRQSTEPGRITRAVARKFAGAKTNRLCAQLVDAGLWEPKDDAWVIHDFAEYLPTEKTRSERSRAGKKGAQARWGTDSKVPSVSHDVATGLIANDGSRADARWEDLPVPIPDEPPPPSVALPTRAQRARRLAETYRDAEPLCDLPKIANVVMRFVQDGRYEDEQINTALEGLAASGRPVTVDTLRIELSGPPRKSSTTDQRVSDGVRLAQRLAAAEQQAERREIGS